MSQDAETRKTGGEQLRYSDVPGRHDSRAVTVYCLMRCEPCRDAREFLSANDVAYRYITVDWQLPQTRIEIKQRLERAFGDRPIYPAIEIDGTLYFGFDAAQWARLLGLPTAP